MSNLEQDPLDFPLPLNAETAPIQSEPGGERTVIAADRLPALPRSESYPPWSAWDVAAVLCFTLAAVFLFSTIGLGVAHLLTGRRHVPVAELASSPIVVIGAQIAAYPAVILFMILLVRSKTGERFWQAIRWNWPGPAMLRFLLGGIGVAFAVEFVSRWLPIPKSLPVDKLFSDITGAYLMAAFGITLAPLLEELFFRGMLYPVLRRSYGMAIAVVVTAGAFATIHGAQLGYAWAPLLSILTVGVVFTLVREHTGSVAASFLMHSGYNLTLFSMLWVGSDHFRHLERMTN